MRADIVYQYIDATKSRRCGVHRTARLRAVGNVQFN
jgi:hypothetical protein